MNEELGVGWGNGPQRFLACAASGNRHVVSRSGRTPVWAVDLWAPWQPECP